MAADYITRDCDEVKTLFQQCATISDALQPDIVTARPSICSERYFTGEEVCEYLHISIRTLQTLRDNREIPFTIVGERTFLYPEVGLQDILKKNYHPTR